MTEPAAPAPGGSPRSSAQRFEDIFYRHRARVLLSILELFLVLVVWWTLSNLVDFHWFGSRPEPWVMPTALAAELGLTLGTLALATAAFFQARSADIQANASSALTVAAEGQVAALKAQVRVLEEQSRLSTRPSLSVQFKGVPLQAGDPHTVRVLSPGDLLGMGEVDHAVQVHNSGPGVAVSVQVEVRGVASAPEIGGEILRKWGFCAEMLGVGETSQVSFPGELARELWPGMAVGPKFAIIVWATGTSAVDVPEGFEEEFSFGGLGGLIVEEVYRSDNAKPDYAWRVLSDGDCTRLVNFQAAPKDLPDSPSKAGRRTMWIRRSDEMVGV